MKVAYLDHCYKQAGGGQISLSKVVQNIRNRGYDPILITATKENYFSKNITDIEQRIVKIPLGILESGRGKLLSNPISMLMYALLAIPSIFRLCSILKEEDVDLVHSNDSLMRVIGGVSSFLCGVPHVSHVRDIFIPNTYTKVYWFIVNVFTHKLISVSKAVSSQYPSIVSDKKSVVIYNPVSIEDDKNRSIKGNNSKKITGNYIKEKTTISMVGNLIEWKGQKYFIEACNMLIRKGYKCNFWVVGDGPKRQELEEHTLKEGIYEDIIFMGHRDDAVSLMEISDIVVNYSEKPDPFPRVVVEAMAMGCAVVAPTEGGASEALGDGDRGVVIEPRDSERLAESLICLLNNPQLREELADRAKTYARKKYTVGIHLEEITSVYREVLS
jgi:glycosyltransferase involved in cell wall biosynthesis